MFQNFYQSLEGFGQFSELTSPSHYVDVPADWYVVITDVRGSTNAIAQGRYKEVNLVGAAAIIAVLNMTGRVPLPYAFGGDGATILIPQHLVDMVRDTLCAVQTRVKAMFDLELRAGCIPVSALYEQKAWLKVAKFQLSPTVEQAAFQGNGLGLAEQWVKKGGGTVITCTPKDDSELSLEGLECRWQPIGNRHGTMLTLLARVTPNHEGRAWEIYSQLLSEIAQIYPESCGAAPVQPDNMNLSFAYKNLSREAILRRGNHLLGYIRYLLIMYVQNAIGYLSFRFKIPVGNFNGQKYLAEMAANSDARKFDEMLRMVLDSSLEQQKRLEALLADHHAKGEIYYGIHLSPEALMTCLVFNLSGNHIHFVDGSDGGYAIAAKQMKEQMAAGT